MSRKAEVVSLWVGRRATRRGLRPRTPSASARTQQVLRAGAQNDTAETWQLIHDDPFDASTTDEQVHEVVAAFAARSSTPHQDVLRCLAGIEESSEEHARAFLGQLLEHRRALAGALGRPVHLRVAALDFLALQASEVGARRDSHPIIVTSSQLERALEEATADGVTGLPQRAQFMSLLRHELRQRRRRNVCVAYIDLDRFKAVNDLHGHARGDDVLRALAQSARGSLRDGDVLARIGGDEFGVLLVDVTPAEAEAAMVRLRARFEALTESVGTSFSSGVTIAEPGEDAEALLVRADELMFQQKRERASQRPPRQLDA